MIRVRTPLFEMASYKSSIETEFHEVFQSFRLIREVSGEREFPMQLALVFFYVCAHNGCSQSKLAEDVGLSPSSVTRNLQWLSTNHRLPHRKGLNWIRRERKPDDYKSKLVFLTETGDAIRQLIIQRLHMARI